MQHGVSAEVDRCAREGSVRMQVRCHIKVFVHSESQFCLVGRGFHRLASGPHLAMVWCLRDWLILGFDRA
jgi:hypothetical protein